MTNQVLFGIFCLSLFCCKKETVPLTIDCLIDGKTYPMTYSAGLDKSGKTFHLNLTYIGSAPEYDVVVYFSEIPFQPGKTLTERRPNGPSAFFEVLNGDYDVDAYDITPPADSSYFVVEQRLADSTGVTGSIHLKLAWFPLYGPKGGDFQDTIIFECHTSKFLFD